MVQRCEHCGQTVMATDKQCWHCGKTLSSSKSQTAKSPQPVTAVSHENAPPMPPFTTILLYAGLTAVALLILITTTRAISHAPLFLANSNTIIPVGWKPVTNSQLQFTLNLPETWHTYELDRAPEALTLRSSPPVQAVTHTFEALVTDTQLIFLGTEDTAAFAEGASSSDVPVFVLVAQSQRLGRLSLDDIIGYAQAQLPENVTLSTVNPLKDADEGQAGSLLFNIDQDEMLWRCLEQIGPGQSGVYLVVTCTSFAEYPRHQTDFEAILRSFQLLGS